MANYADAVWTAGQYKLDEMMNKPEFKYKPSNVLMVLLKNTNFLVPASERERLWNQKPSDTSSVTLKTLNKQSISTGSARAHNHTGNSNDADTTTASYTIYQAPFKYSLKTGDRQVFAQAEMVAAQIRSACIALHEAIETAMVAWLNTNKTQVVISATPQSGVWDGSNYLFGVAQADKEQYFQFLQLFMREQYYKGPFEVINNIRAHSQASYLAQQGMANATNLGWQMGNMMLTDTTELSNESGYDQMSYILPEGSVGILPWIPTLNRNGHGDIFANGGQYSTLPDPLGSGLTFAVHQYAEGADNSSTYGETQDVNIYVELSIDLAPIVAPMSTSNLSPIVKAGLLT